MALASQDCQRAVRLKLEIEDFAWKGLLRIGGIAALLAGLLFRRNLGAELTLLKGSGLITAGPTTPPTTAPAWFTLLQSNPLVGLTWLNVFDLVNYALVGIMFLALFVSLRQVNRSAMVMATTFGLAGIAVYFASNQSLTLLSLSNQYVAATTAAQRSMLLNDGQMLLAINQFGSPGRYLSLLLIAVAGLLISSVMLRSNVYNRATAYVGMLAAILDLAYCLAVALMPAVDSELLAVCFIPAAGLCLMIWHILIGRRLYRQGQVTGQTQLQEWQKETNMSTSILVTYASSYGSTQEVAEVVAATLRKQGVEVDLRPIREVRTLAGHGAVVLGAPLYMFHWHKDARHFLARFQRDLTNGLPIAIFAGGPIGDSDEKAWQEIRGNLDQELAKFSWLTPVSVQLIGGKFDPAKLHFPYSLIPALRKMPASDLRDWTAIRAWASSLADKFQPVASH